MREGSCVLIVSESDRESQGAGYKLSEWWPLSHIIQNLLASLLCGATRVHIYVYNNGACLCECVYMRRRRRSNLSGGWPCITREITRSQVFLYAACAGRLLDLVGERTQSERRFQHTLSVWERAAAESVCATLKYTYRPQPYNIMIGWTSGIKLSPPHDYLI